MSKILCIEDDSQTASLLSEALNEFGYEATVARDGEEGLTAILSEKPDLVVCDVRMPKMNGFEVLERVAAAGPDYAAIPFVFLTALGDRDSELTGRRFGADDYLTKPIDFEMLAHGDPEQAPPLAKAPAGRIITLRSVNARCSPGSGAGRRHRRLRSFWASASAP